MDFRRLEAFSKVYECRSFSKAGQLLFLSQPTISAHVIALEDELGVRLFDRLGRVVLPTPAAEILYTHAQDAFGILEKARAEILLVNDRVAGDLYIGGSTIPANYVLPELLAKFTRLHPDVHLRVELGDSHDILGLLSSGSLPLGMVGAKVPSSDVAFEEVLRDELVVLASPALAEQYNAAPELTTLTQLPWVMREQGSGTRRALEQALNAVGVNIRKLNTAISVESTESVMRCVLAGLGISVTSKLVAQEFLEQGKLVLLEVPELHMVRSFYLAYNERREMFPAARYFLDFVREELQARENHVPAQSRAQEK
ncbi:selenium metabolism-associated LysR family transcriptional regulator [Desulfobaculum bizertense]|uniref:DNA-binding transcriptional regulator, LysR family n=1 Tax=Desulfobaculum bizertense DSM 18034 TaxID=1121442 RepID=A0A1T4WFU0_9BACT|nr:selenium metabolism-associated LysR family transcriptional regulator [Desulfobaculum bizertense]UIJ36644.1 LysR family transcriptional regulator [Desulfobaculum bizertense]SKA76206.1 DNA-binding transcriptional regulator, LysR family [Desulfobaculum bizertense DSM 18034]